MRRDHTYDLTLAELGALRAELNSVIDRMNGNENFSAGTVSAIFAFILTNAISSISMVLALISTLVVWIGYLRYIELRRHTHRLDKYLIEMEKKLTVSGGWTIHYHSLIEDDPSGGYSQTRHIFWLSLGLLCVLGSLFTVFSLAER